MELVTIIMPVNNAETFIDRSVKSVLAQSYKNWELIIISDDKINYSFVLKNFGITDKRIKFISMDKKGISSSRNMGLQHAKGNIITILDSDDIIHPDKLKHCVPVTRQHYLVSCALDICDENGTTLRHVGKNERGILESNRYKKVNFSTDSMIIFDKTKIPCFYDESFSCMEDLEFLLKCFEHIDHTYHFSIPLHKYYKRLHSVSNNDVNDKFIDAQRKLLSRLQNQFYKFKDKKLEENITYFLQISIESEILFHEELKRNPKILFENIIESKL